MGWLILALLVAFPAGAWRIHGVRVKRRLRHPSLKGVPLPVVDDPRWRPSGDTRAELGPFAVARRYAWEGGTEYEVYFDGKWLADWKAYVNAVLGRLEAKRLEGISNRALAAICDDQPPTQPNSDSKKVTP